MKTNLQKYFEYLDLSFDEFKENEEEITQNANNLLMSLNNQELEILISKLKTSQLASFAHFSCSLLDDSFTEDEEYIRCFLRWLDSHIYNHQLIYDKNKKLDDEDKKCREYMTKYCENYIKSHLMTENKMLN